MNLKLGSENPNKGKKYIHKTNVSNLINIVEEYFRDGNEEINGSTIYKGVPIGQMLIYLRYDISSGRRYLPPEILKKLNETCLLTRATSEL